MNIANGKYPPNYDEIVKAIPAVANNPNIIFTYGHTLYVPNRSAIPKHLMAHEETHAEEQKWGGIDAWWAQYLKDPHFRLEQELKAYRAQYKVLMRRGTPKFQQSMVLRKICADLAGPMYDGLVDFETARKLITGEMEL